MRLAQTVGRQTAHDVVHKLAMRSFEERRDFGDLLASDVRVSGAVDPAELETLLDPGWYLGLADSAIDAVLAKVARITSDC
jgi:adenylosuccinate lyase